MNKINPIEELIHAYKQSNGDGVGIGKQIIIEEAEAYLARITTDKNLLRKALKLSAEMFHGSALAYGGSIHDAGKFTDCNNGCCMKAAAALKDSM